MFGYVRPNKNELKVKEFELYKSTYCGLCRVMGKRYSYIYKMSLSYDFVFMVLLRLYASPEKVTFSRRRCIAHPTKKRGMMDENEALRITSDVGVIMLYHDFLDKINDKDGGAKRFFVKLLMPELKRLRKRACKNPMIKEFDKIAQERLGNLSKLEKEMTKSVDMPAEEFGCLLGEALSIGMEGINKRTVYEVGKNIGKWIYVTDAVDDIDSDAKSGSYNPLLAMSENAEKAKEEFNTINFTLLNILSNADKALELMDRTDIGVYDILSNTLRLGMVETQENILKKNKFITAEKEKTQNE